MNVNKYLKSKSLCHDTKTESGNLNSYMVMPSQNFIPQLPTEYLITSQVAATQHTL